MKAFLTLSTLLVSTYAAPQFLGTRGLVGGRSLVGGVVGTLGAGQTSHQSVSKPFQGEHRAVSQSKAFGSNVAAVSDHPNALHGAHSNRVGVIRTGLSHGVVGGHGLIGGVGHGLVGGVGHGLVGGVGHGLVGGVRHGLGGVGHGLVGGVGHGLVGGLGHGLVGGVGHGLVGGVGHRLVGGVGHGLIGGVRHGVVGHAAEVYPDEISPYTYQYNVADDYSGSNFQATESDDGTGVRDGSYSVALPDGRVQHVAYHANDLDGYVAQVTYDGTAAYPQAVAGGARLVGGAAVVARPGIVGRPLIG